MKYTPKPSEQDQLAATKLAIEKARLAKLERVRAMKTYPAAARGTVRMEAEFMATM